MTVESLIRAAATIAAMALIVIPADIQAQQTGPMSDPDYVTRVMTAAPPSVVKGATIVEMQPGGNDAHDPNWIERIHVHDAGSGDTDVRRSERHGVGACLHDACCPAQQRRLRLYAGGRWRRQQYRSVCEGTSARQPLGKDRTARDDRRAGRE